MRFGITTAGSISTDHPIEDDPQKTLAALERLRGSQEAFVARINAVQYDEKKSAIRKALVSARRLGDAGFQVSTELRYNPSSEPGAEGYALWVRKAVRSLASVDEVAVIQVTHEVDVDGGPTHSDGSFPGSSDALLQGLVAADETLAAVGHDAEVGFTYNPDSVTESQGDEQFWTLVRDEGAGGFIDALDWVGVDFFPDFAAPPERVGLDITGALARTRCWMSYAGIPPEVPIHVTQNSYFSPDEGSDEAQEAALEEMLRAVHEHRDTFNVTDYLWFTLRDHDSSGPEAPTRQGLLRTDYTPKPSFETYQALIEELG